MDLGKNWQRSTCTKFSEAELVRQGELGASALRAVLLKSQVRSPSFSVGLNVSTPNKLEIVNFVNL